MMYNYKKTHTYLHTRDPKQGIHPGELTVAWSNLDTWKWFQMGHIISTLSWSWWAGGFTSGFGCGRCTLKARGKCGRSKSWPEKLDITAPVPILSWTARICFDGTQARTFLTATSSKHGCRYTRERIHYKGVVETGFHVVWGVFPLATKKEFKM